MHRRPWQGWDDLAPMQEMLARALRDTPERALFHPGDLAWWVAWPPQTDDELATRVTIVEDDDGAIVGWRYLEPKEVSEWVGSDVADAEAVWRELDAALASQPQLARSIREDDEPSAAHLRAAGYEPMDECMIGFTLDLAALDLGDPDERVRPVAIGDDLGPRAAITRAAFGVERPFDRYVQDYEAFTRSPVYPEGWDLVAWASPDVAAACTIVWTDPISLVGNFEPVAAHPDLHRQGYASAVMREGLRRLRAAGMQRATVCTPFDNHRAVGLYRSLGFQDDYIQRWFHRP